VVYLLQTLIEKLMEAIELRIGNWVNGSHNGFSKDVKIHSFDNIHIQHTSKTTPILPLESFKCYRRKQLMHQHWNS